MAHAITRVEGFEGGHIDAASNGNGAVLSSVQSGIVRSGDYALRVDPNGASSEFNTFAFAYDTNGLASITQDFAAVALRFALRIVAYPSTGGLQVFTLLSQAGVIQSNFTMSTTGVLTVDGTPGATALSLNTWYVLKLLYDSAGAGTISLLIDGLEEFLNVVPVANDPAGRFRIGKTGTAGTYDIVIDDMVFEGAASVSLIDYPEDGRVLPMEVNGDGTYDGVWITSPVTNPSFPLVLPPYDGDSSLIATSGGGSPRQSYTLANTGLGFSGIVQTINAVQFGAMMRHNGGVSNYQMFVRGGNPVSDVALISNHQNASYAQVGNCRVLSPFTSAAWTLDELDAMEFGVQGIAIGTQVRCSLMTIQVDFNPDPGTGVNQTFLDQAELVTGPLRSITNYDPTWKMKLTSEDIPPGIPDEAFNVIALSIRHVPSGVGVLQGSWFFDQQPPTSFTLHLNPLRHDLLHAGSNSSFTFDESDMVDGYQVYTEYVPIEGSGKVFELILTQEGSRGTEILTLSFDIEPEGKREAYLEAQY